jgi:TRAP-type C4-dicarboxylate transport system substrate-binding protein
MSNEVRGKVMKHLEKKERTYKGNYKYGFNLETATFEQVLDYIESMGYKTKDEFRSKSKNVYSQIPKEVREKVMKQLERTYKEKRTNKTKKNIVKSRDRYNYYSTSTNPNINLKYSVEESVHKILKTII